MRMGKNVYYSLEEMLGMIKEPAKSKCFRMLKENEEVFLQAAGASYNHQTWRGGYIDHLREAMNIAIVLYEAFNELRPLGFKLSDALLVIFLHDLEKPWRYTASKNDKKSLDKKEKRHDFRLNKIFEYGISLTKNQENAIRYIEGELSDYSPRRRVMNPLAAFCHLADITSARMWFDCPRPRDSWGRRSK